MSTPTPTPERTDLPRIEQHEPGPPTPPPSPRPPRGLLVVGVLLVVAGTIWLAAELGLFDIGWATLAAGSLVLTGLAAMVLALTGHDAGPLIAVGVMLTVVLAVTATTDRLVLDGGIGERVERPTTVAALEEPFELGIGSLQLDLRELDLPPGTTEVAAAVSIGELVVTVPDDVAVRVLAEVDVGEARLFGEETSGTDVTADASSGPAGTERVIDLDLSVTFGNIQVRTAE